MEFPGSQDEPGDAEVDGIAPLKEILAALAENHGRPMFSLELFNEEYWRLPALEAARIGLAKMMAVIAAAGLA